MCRRVNDGITHDQEKLMHPLVVYFTHGSSSHDSLKVVRKVNIILEDEDIFILLCERISNLQQTRIFKIESIISVDIINMTAITWNLIAPLLAK